MNVSRDLDAIQTQAVSWNTKEIRYVLQRVCYVCLCKNKDNYVLFSLKFAMDFSQSFFSNISFAFVTTKLHTMMALKDRFVSLFSFRPLIQNKLEVLGKAGLSEDMLEADCTFFKVFFNIHK